MSEFSLIEQYCQGIGVELEHTIVGVGDDAAVVQVPPEMQLVVSVDTMVEGVHFATDVRPEDLAYKLLAVNLSDMAAMGAEPKWVTLALTLPSENAAWLRAFSQSLNSAASHAGVQLIGGDTTKGPLCLSMQIMGLCPIGKVIYRSGSQTGEDVWVSNTVGDAALALQVTKGEISLDKSASDHVLRALHRPMPQVALGMALRGIATAALDISDGLLADLAHIAERSAVSLQVDQSLVPVSSIYKYYLSNGGDYTLALSGGDDYQLGFTADSADRQRINDLAELLCVPLTRIGQVIEQQASPIVLLDGGKSVKLDPDLGFQHFN